FQISPETATYIRVAVRRKVFRHLSGERLLRELLFLLMEHRPVGSLRLLSQLGLLNAIHPALSLSARRLGLLERVERTLSWYDSLPARAEPLLRWQVYLLALVDGLDRRRLVSLLDRLAIRGRARAVFLAAGAAVRSLEGAFRRLPADRARIHSIGSRHPSEVLVFASARTQRRSVRGALGNYLTQLAGTRLEISGRDLKEMGLEPGPAFARILREVLRRKLRGEVSGRQEELHLARQIAEGQGRSLSEY
ncbi:MAG: hypothetical protein HY509_00070, partial [Acidobacteria bacterium]|nr:hypothetical protein [Acidobacteriota bacterium]